MKKQILILTGLTSTIMLNSENIIANKSYKYSEIKKMMQNSKLNLKLSQENIQNEYDRVIQLPIEERKEIANGVINDFDVTISNHFALTANNLLCLQKNWKTEQIDNFRNHLAKIIIEGKKTEFKIDGDINADPISKKSTEVGWDYNDGKVYIKWSW
jgi:hypothetical protein